MLTVVGRPGAVHIEEVLLTERGSTRWGMSGAVEPVGCLAMIMLERFARAIGTDGGGVQKEAYFHKVPCITVREETEWVELLEAGVNQLTGTARNSIAQALRSQPAFHPSASETLYGDGRAGARIADFFSRDAARDQAAS
jgi:UDP-GlcNAc3NAcA epimerase